MKNHTPKAACTMLLVSGAIALGAEPQTTDTLADTLTETITEMASTISENYVFPDKGEAIASLLMQSLENGDYDELNRPELAHTLEGQIRELTHDLHFGVRPLPQGWTPPSDEDEDVSFRPGPQAPYGFESVQRLSGNIGYIDLRGFNPARAIDETIEAAMILLQGSNSVIFDLRKNGGGDPAAVQLISSYFFDPSEPVHLNSLYFRPDDRTTEFWTHDNIEISLAMPDVPMYVLTSGRTFSAAEEFTYNLKNLERATIIGETTGGGAHPVDSLIFNNELMVILPIARAINPISGTNWEGTGVSPDIQTDADDALNVAISHALQASLDAGDESARWGLANIQADLSPIQLSEDLINELVGQYGPRHIRKGELGVEYRREGVSQWRPLICFGADQFVIEGFDSFIMEFKRDDSGSIIGIEGQYPQRDPDFSARNES